MKLTVTCRKCKLTRFHTDPCPNCTPTWTRASVVNMPCQHHAQPIEKLPVQNFHDAARLEYQLRLATS